MARGLRLPATGEEYLRLALIALFVPTIYGLASGDADWLFGAFRSTEEAIADPLDVGFALAGPALITWTAVLSSYWLRSYPGMSMALAAVVSGVIIWPYVDARDLVDRTHDTYHSIRRVWILFWRERPDSVLEGAVLGLACAMTWQGLGWISARRGADNRI